MGHKHINKPYYSHTIANIVNWREGARTRPPTGRQIYVCLSSGLGEGAGPAYIYILYVGPEVVNLRSHAYTL